MIHVAIVDDLLQDTQQLAALLHDYSTANQLSRKVDCFSSGEEFLEAARPGRYSLVFLDILMKGFNGIDTARKFRMLDTGALLVFITTESGYAVDGYEVDASGFLVKTFSPNTQAFCKMMDRLTSKLGNVFFLDLSNTELQLRLPVETLQYIDVRDHRLDIHTPEKTYHLRMPMEKLKELLPPDGRFFQCHRGILINLD